MSDTPSPAPNQTPRNPSVHRSVSLSEADEANDPEPSRWRAYFAGEGRQPKVREEEIKENLHDLGLYILFLIVVLIATLGMTNTIVMYFTRAIIRTFVEPPIRGNYTDLNFKNMNTMPHFWNYLETVWIDNLYWDEQNSPSRAETTASKQPHILNENRVLGRVRMRQLKVRNDTCVVPLKFRRSFATCFSEYKPEAEDKETFGPTGDGEQGFEYNSEEQLDESSYSSKLATYMGGGFVVLMPTDGGKAVTVLDNLKENLWLTRGTRVVFLDLTLYNANLNMFCIIKLVVEFPPTGGLVTSWSVRSLKLLRYESALDFFILANEILMFIFILYYAVLLVNGVVSNGLAYFRSGWNILDLLIVILGFVCIVFAIYRVAVVAPKLHSLMDVEEYADFFAVGQWEIHYINTAAVLVFFVWFKLLKFISFNRSMSQITTTLSRCFKDICLFSIMFFIVFLAFALLGFLLFGNELKEFYTVGGSMFTLMRAILGDFEYTHIEAVNSFLGPLYFVLFIFIVIFILLNMFLAIVNVTYSQVKSEPTNWLTMGDYLSHGYGNIMSKCFGRPSPSPLESGMVKEVKEMLYRRGFTKEEVKEFFNVYYIDEDNELLERATGLPPDMAKLREPSVAGLSAKDKQALKAMGIPQDVWSGVEHRVAQLEEMVFDTNDKMNVIISRLEGLRRRASEH